MPTFRDDLIIHKDIFCKQTAAWSYIYNSDANTRSSSDLVALPVSLMMAMADCAASMARRTVKTAMPTNKASLGGHSTNSKGPTT